MFDNNGKWIHKATKYAWFWVDVYEQKTDEGWQDAPEMHRLYDGPHLYPQEAVLFLIDEGFIQPNADNLPWGWIPTHTRPASHIRDAFEEIASIWDDIEAGRRERTSMILARIGVMTTQHRRRRIGYNTTVDEDVPGCEN